MNNENQNPQNIEEENPEETKPLPSSIMESVEFIVNMMNEGKVNPKDVYPPGRYHGD